MRLDGIEDLMTIDLRAGSVSLRLLDTNPSWCRLQVVTTLATVDLGADALPILVERLHRALADSLEGPSEIHDGMTVYWVLSTSDPDASVYAADVNGMRELLFLDARGQEVGRVALSARDRRSWQGVLGPPGIEVRWPPLKLRYE